MNGKKRTRSWHINPLCYSEKENVHLKQQTQVTGGCEGGRDIYNTFHFVLLVRYVKVTAVPQPSVQNGIAGFSLIGWLLSMQGSDPAGRHEWLHQFSTLSC